VEGLSLLLTRLFVAGLLGLTGDLRGGFVPGLRLLFSGFFPWPFSPVGRCLAGEALGDGEVLGDGEALGDGLGEGRGEGLGDGLGDGLVRVLPLEVGVRRFVGLLGGCPCPPLDPDDVTAAVFVGDAAAAAVLAAPDVVGGAGEGPRAFVGDVPSRGCCRC